ncbi:Epithelial splicing regulatory protein 1 [Sphaceloma murrayae]|uniref:Epithelial splicing regulatory protein 1 n=1 Tax=Sphaceloma murrayae TaxID=2082308 RepID=A0A2K1QIY0_9PEZI|nr:Epithelial splicing regulatory protein 1 [Sphaceloma murrayae]
MSADKPVCATCAQVIIGITGAGPSPPVSPPVRTPPQTTYGHPDFVPQTPGPQTFFRAPATSTGSAVQSPTVERGVVYSPSDYGSSSPPPERDRAMAMTSSGRHITFPLGFQSLRVVPEDPFSDSDRVSAPHGFASPGADDPATIAARIKSGSFPNNAGPRSGSMHRLGRDSHAISGPVLDTSPPPAIRHWGAHMIDAVPDPPFLAAALRGEGDGPSLETAIKYVPFTEPAKHIHPAAVGVIRITNIPYATSKPEIIAAIGRNVRIIAQPPGTPFNAIHIIMDRGTGKTLDCFVEVEDKNEAQNAVNNFQSRRSRGRAPRVGDRHINIEVSSVEVLMKRLFPKANCIQWWGAIPVAYQPSEEYNSGFQGFVTIEELSQLLKHADNPTRSPFTNRAVNRAYETLISMLFKYPWYKPEMITFRERAALFKTTCQMLKALLKFVGNGVDPVQLTQPLLQELVCAALTVPFGHKDKYAIAEMVHQAGFGHLIASIGYQPMTEHSKHWPFEVLDKKAGVRNEVFYWYASQLHKSTTVDVSLDITDEEAVDLSTNPFGALKVRYPCDIRRMTLAEVTDNEWDTITRSLYHVLKKFSPVQKQLTASSSDVPALPEDASKKALIVKGKAQNLSPVSPVQSEAGGVLLGLGDRSLSSGLLSNASAKTATSGGLARSTSVQNGWVPYRPQRTNDGFDSIAERLASVNVGTRRVTSPAAHQEGIQPQTAWSPTSSEDSVTGNPDLGSPIPAPRRGLSTNRFYDKRAGFIGPAGYYMGFSSKNNSPVKSGSQGGKSAFDPAPGAHLRKPVGTTSGMDPMKQRDPSSQPNAGNAYHEAPTHGSKRSIYELPAESKPFPTFELPAQFSGGLKAPNLTAAPGTTTNRAPSPPRSPLFTRISEHFPSLGSMPLQAVLGRSKRSTSPNKLTKTRLAENTDASAQSSKSSGSLNPGATPFTSPLEGLGANVPRSSIPGTSGGVKVEKQTGRLSFAQIAAKRGITIGGKEKEKKDAKGKGIVKEADQGWDP